MTTSDRPDPTTSLPRGPPVPGPPPTWPTPAGQAGRPVAGTWGGVLSTHVPVSGLALKRRNVVGVWLGLPLITLGLYTWVWWYKINAEMGRFDPRRPVSAGTSLLAITLGSLLIIPPYVSVYTTGKRIAERQHAAGIGSSCSPVIGLVLVFVFGLYSLYYQSELNKISDHLGNPPAGTPVTLAA